MSKVSFKDLPEELRGLVIELTLTRVRTDKTYPMEAAADEALRAAQVLYGVDLVEEKEEDEEDVSFTEEELKAVEFFRNLLEGSKPIQHCGNPSCAGCNDVFGKPEATEPEAKPKYTHIKGFGYGERPLINVYRLKSDPLVYAVTQGDRTVILKGGPNFDIPVHLVQQILDKHGRTDISLD